MSASNFPSINHQMLKQMLDEVYKHMHEINRMLSILSISEDLELQAPVEKGWVKIEFVDRPKVKYFVYPSPLETTVEVADSTVPIPPYIDLTVENGSFEYVKVPSIIIKGDEYELHPITALALAKTMMRRSRYTIKASHQALENFVTNFIDEMEAPDVMRAAEQMIEEFTKNSRKVEILSPDIELIVESAPLLFIYYRANGHPEPYIFAGIYIETEAPGEDGELEPSILQIPILYYTGSTVRLDKDLDMEFQMDRLIGTLSRVVTSKVLHEVKNWLSDFVQEFAKAIIVAKMYSI